MLYVAAAVAMVAVLVILAFMRARQPGGLDALGSVSERWVAQQRSSSYNNH